MKAEKEVRLMLEDALERYHWDSTRNPDAYGTALILSSVLELTDEEATAFSEEIAARMRAKARRKGLVE